MTDLNNAFKKGKAFVPFITAGDPSLEATARFLKILEKCGADAIEIGIPFSDPTAEGEVIEQADLRALAAGTTLDKIFEMLAGVDINVPLLFMTYANPVFAYGYEAFFKRCKASGICGVIVPDVPFEESGEVKDVAKKYGITVIDMVAPTSDKRIEMVCKNSQGFIYLVSSMGVTGVRSALGCDVGAVTKKIREVTSTPVCVGFGISSPEQAANAAAHADGAIMGSAIVRIIGRLGEQADSELEKFVTAVANAVHSVPASF